MNNAGKIPYMLLLNCTKMKMLHSSQCESTCNFKFNGLEYHKREPLLQSEQLCLKRRTHAGLQACKPTRSMLVRIALETDSKQRLRYSTLTLEGIDILSSSHRQKGIIDQFVGSRRHRTLNLVVMATFSPVL